MDSKASLWQDFAKLFKNSHSKMGIFITRGRLEFPKMGTQS